MHDEHHDHNKYDNDVDDHGSNEPPIDRPLKDKINWLISSGDDRIDNGEDGSDDFKVDENINEFNLGGVGYCFIDGRNESNESQGNCGDNCQLIG